jgi:hypothetical protein
MMERLSDIELYRKLRLIEREIVEMAELAMSPRARVALEAVASMIRRVASAFFKVAF